MPTASDQPAPRLKLPAVPPVIFGTPLLIGLVLHFVLGEPFLPWPAAIGAGAALIVAGLGLIAWAVVTMYRAGEDPEPHKPTKSLVTSGPFRLTRNPIYLSFALVAGGIGLAMNSIPVLASVPFSAAAVHWLVIRREEEYLGRLFGEEYRQYRSRVRRWI